MSDNFYDTLYDMKKMSLLNHVSYNSLSFENTYKVNTYLDDIVSNNRTVFIYGDYDPDGMYSAIIAEEALHMLGCTNTYVYNYRLRTHLLDDFAVIECIQMRPDYMIICDTGSSEIEKIKKLISYGIKVILLDHHNTRFTYDDFSEIAMINTMIENQIIKDRGDAESSINDCVYKLSAGALTFCVMDRFAETINKDIKILSSYALITLYSDCMDMTNTINRSIYFLAQTFSKDDLPTGIQIFMNSNSNFYSRFIQFKLVPQINSIFRTEKFIYLNKCMFNHDIDAIEKAKYLDTINEIYVNNRTMVASVADIIDYKELENFVIADLQTVEKFFRIAENKLYNYTGLIANKLSDRFGKPTVVYCNMGNYYKGSFRDIAGRNYLQVFKQFCKSDGHNAAFGIIIPYFEFDTFKKVLTRLNSNIPLQKVNNTPIIISYERQNPDIKLINDIALYNEFAGQGTPIIYMRKMFTANMTGGKTKFYNLYHWGNCIIQSDFSLNVGSYVLMKPIRSSGTRVIVVNAQKLAF